MAGSIEVVTAQPAAPANCVFLEVFVKTDCKECADYEKALVDFASKRDGLKVRTINIDADPKNLERLDKVRKHFKLENATVPIVYGCNSFLHNFDTEKKMLAGVERMLTINAYVREGCPHCAAAKQFLPDLARRYPAFRLQFHDVVADERALERMEAVIEKYRRQASSLPVIQICNQLVIGYDEDETTGKRLESILKYWSSRCPAEKPAARPATPKTSSKPNAFIPVARSSATGARIQAAAVPLYIVTLLALLSQTELEDAGNDDPVPDSDPVPETSFSGGDEAPPPPLGSDDDSDLAPIGLADDLPIPSENSGGSVSEAMDVPVFGSLSPRNLGMPTFTFMVGLVDGFNPCAMWVLMFLLSLLVNLKSRAKILAVAGTFVIISGLAYFAFMSAWLNVFLLIGYLRPAQITLGVMSICVGSVHIKDFLAPGRGVSLSIPDAAKPGIYDRVRKIVMAENLTGAVAGAIVLAVLVNVIELLCTAGLPAMYTQILTMQDYPPWKNYAMLGLYNLAYMLDDSLMVGIVVITLGKHKLQENEGRWLKLFSGLVVLTLGVVMIFTPEMLK
ncbi:MAG: hypothetical protein ACKVT0_04630 [Planctomycetaceae bacterium]